MSCKNLNTFERSLILRNRDTGRNISQIAEELQMTRRTVRRWLRRFDAEGNVETRPRPAPPRIITPERVQHIVKTFEQHPSTSTKIFAQEYECSLGTVQQALREAGIRHVKPAKRITLTDQQKAARVCFARDYRDYDFSHAIFTDEKTFISTETGRRHLWRLNSKRYESRNSDPNMKTDRVAVNMWAWMCAAGPGELLYLPGRTTGASYLELLQDVLVPTVRVVYPEDVVPEILFLQHNSSIHRSKVVQRWIQQQPNLRTVSWPSSSPDLNPMENLWAIMMQRWGVRNERSVEALMTHIDQVWDSLRGTDLCDILVKSMRRRCDAVIDAGGAMTKY